MDRGRKRDTLAAGTTLAIGTILILAGSWHLLAGYAAVADSSLLSQGEPYPHGLSVGTWGWIFLAVGAGAIVTGIGVLNGTTWGRVVGIVLASIAAMADFLFLPAYPPWSVANLAIAVLVIWALATWHPHGPPEE